MNTITNRFYTAQFVGNKVSVRDGSTNQSIGGVGVNVFEKPMDVGVNEKTNHVFVATANGVMVIDGETNTVIAKGKTGGNPGFVGVNADAGLIYIANRGSGDITVIKDDLSLFATPIPTPRPTTEPCFTNASIEIVDIDPSLGTILTADETQTFTATIQYSFKAAEGFIGFIQLAIIAEAPSSPGSVLVSDQLQISSQTGVETITLTTDISRQDKQPIESIIASASLRLQGNTCESINADVIYDTDITTVTTPAPVITPVPSGQDQVFVCNDPEGDVSAADYLDVTRFAVSVSGDNVTGTFNLKDVPTELVLNRVGVPENFIEYTWQVKIDTDNDLQTGDRSGTGFDGIDFFIAANHFVFEPNTAVSMPIEQGVQTDVFKFDEKHGSFSPISKAFINFDDQNNIITLTGDVPGISSNARFSFETSEFDVETGFAKGDFSDNCAIDVETTTTPTPIANQTPTPMPIISDSNPKVLPVAEYMPDSNSVKVSFTKKMDVSILLEFKNLPRVISTTGGEPILVRSMRVESNLMGASVLLGDEITNVDTYTLCQTKQTKYKGARNSYKPGSL